MSNSLTAPTAYGSTPVAAAENSVDDSQPRLPAGWWLLPAIVIGAGMWVGLAALILL